jgi:dimethylglycine dehydrogenase
MAHAFVPTELIAPGLEAEIEILGVRRKARRIDTPLFDADGARLRG